MVVCFRLLTVLKWEGTIAEFRLKWKWIYRRIVVLVIYHATTTFGNRIINYIFSPNPQRLKIEISLVALHWPWAAGNLSQYLLDQYLCGWFWKSHSGGVRSIPHHSYHKTLSYSVFEQTTEFMECYCAFRCDWKGKNLLWNLTYWRAGLSHHVLFTGFCMLYSIPRKVVEQLILETISRHKKDKKIIKAVNSGLPRGSNA